MATKIPEVLEEKSDTIVDMLISSLAPFTGRATESARKPAMAFICLDHSELIKLVMNRQNLIELRAVKCTSINDKVGKLSRLVVKRFHDHLCQILIH